MERFDDPGSIEREDFCASLGEAWAREAAQKQRLAIARRARALEAAREIARHLQEQYRVKGVYLYGSLAWGKNFTERSDLDLLVEGFPPEADYWRLLVEAEHLAPSFPVSIVLAEDAFPGLYARAVKEGIPL